MKKSIIRITAIVLSMIFLLSACGSTNQDAGTTGAAENNAQSPASPANPASPASPAIPSSPAELPGANIDIGTVLSDEMLTIALESEPTSLFPALFTDSQATDQMINPCLYDNFAFLNTNTGEVEPRVATSWEWIDDYHMRLKIRDDVYSYGGYRVTAYDIAEAAKHTVEFGVNFTNFNMLDKDKIYAEDDTTLVLGTLDIYPTLPAMFYAPCWVPIISMEALEAQGGWDAAFRTPYMNAGRYFVDEWVEGQYVQLVRNDDYWDQGALPYYKYLRFVFTPDPTTRAMAVQSGSVDYAIRISGTQVDALTVAGITVDPVSSAVSFSFFMNTERAPFNDVNFRKAVQMLIDYDGVIQIGTNGLSEHVQTIIALSNPYYLRSFTGFPNEVDIDKAKELIAQTSYNGERLVISTEPSNAQVMEYVQACLIAGGLNVELQVLESASYRTEMASGEYDMNVVPADNSNLARVLNRLDGRVSTEISSGGTQYKNETTYALIDIARYTMDDSAREKALHELQQHIIDNAVMIGLYNTTEIHAHRSDIGTKYHLHMGHPLFWSTAPIS